MIPARPHAGRGARGKSAEAVGLQPLRSNLGMSVRREEIRALAVSQEKTRLVSPSRIRRMSGDRPPRAVRLDDVRRNPASPETAANAGQAAE